MNKILTAILLFVCAFSYSQTAYWRFENNGNDEMGNYTLIPKNGAEYVESANTWDGSYVGSVNGSTRRFDSHDKIDLSSGGITISFGFQTWNGTGVYNLFSNTINSTSQGLSVQADMNNGRVTVRLHDGNGSDMAYSANSVLSSGSSYHHITIRMMDADGQYVKVFINGVQSGTDSIARSGAGRNDTIRIGSYRDNSYNTYGGIDKFIIWNCALTDDEIYSLYTNRTSTEVPSCPSSGTGGLPVGSYTSFINGVEWRNYIDDQLYSHWITPYTGAPVDPPDQQFSMSGYGYDSTYLLAAKQFYAIPETISNNNYVGYWLKNLTYRSGNTITYSIEHDPMGGAFAINKINNDSALITIADASKIKFQITQQDSIVNLLIRTTDEVLGYVIDTAQVRIKENSYCVFFNNVEDFNNATLVPGYGYFLKRGETYTSAGKTIVAHIATGENPTVIAAYGIGTDPVWEGNNSGRPFWFGGYSSVPSSDRAEYIYIYNQHFQNYAGDIRSYNPTNNLGFYSCHFYNLNNNGDGEGSHLTFNTSTYSNYYDSVPFSIVNCKFDVLTHGSPASYVKVGAGPLLLQNNYFGVTNNVLTYAYPVRHTAGSYSTIKHNVIEMGDKDARIGLQLRSSYTDVIDNWFKGEPQDVSIHLIMQGSTIPEISPSHNLIKNNEATAGNNYYRGAIVVSPGYWEGGVPSDSIYIEDNLLYSLNGDKRLINIGDVTNLGIRRNTLRDADTAIYISSGDYIEISYNEIFDIATTGIRINSGNYHALWNNTVDASIVSSGTIVNNLYRSATNQTSNNIDLDTITIADYFTNYAARDFSLKETALGAIDKGNESAGFNYDIRGVEVPQGSLPDIGAYEYYNEEPGEPGEPPVGDFTIYESWDFESLTLGQQLPSTYFGSPVMHYNLDKTSIVYDAELEKKVVQIAAYPGLYGVNAVELFADISSYGDFTELYYTFDWKFDKDFRNTWGGKMPGLSGVGAGVINASMTGGPAANEGWKYRIMFGNAGYQSLYGYDHTSAYSYPWNTHQYPTIATPERTMDRFMNYGNWYSVTIRVVLNTCTDCNDGYAEVWVDDRKVLQQTNLRQWSVSNIGNYIDVMSVNHFYGGNTSEYDPEVTCYSYYANPRIWTPKTLQAGLYDYSYLLSVPGQLEPSIFEHDVLITTEGTFQNSEYGDFYTSMKDETWLIDAGEGNTVTLSYSSGLGINDFFLVFDGDKTDAENIYMHAGSVTANTNGSVTSSGRYMFVRFATDKSGFSTGINCSVSFNQPVE